jgi:hypothetical protein
MIDTHTVEYISSFGGGGGLFIANNRYTLTDVKVCLGVACFFHKASSGVFLYLKVKKSKDIPVTGLGGL